MLSSSSTINPSQLNSLITTDTDILSQSTNPPSRSLYNMPRETETAFESKFRKTLPNKKFSKHYISGKDIPRIKDSLEKSGILANKIGEIIKVRELPKISQEDYDKFKASFTNQEYLNGLLKKIHETNCNIKSVDANNSLGGLTPLTYLVESSFSMSPKKANEINEKYNLLKPYIYNYRTINGDGNCFYRAAMFRYLEILVLNKQIEYLQNVTLDVNNSLNSEEIKARLNIGNIIVKPNLTINLLILITDLVKGGNITLAHNILVRSFSICRIFDYAIILYFRYILYDYIKKNEEKIYTKSFPIQLGNLLPSQYETEEGKFLYELFYNNYLLKFYTDAEKIVIYLTPFVLGVPLNVIIYDDNEEEILQNFKWEEGKGLNVTDEIQLLNRKNHYEIIYTLKDNEKNKKIFENYENHQKSVILSNIENYLKQNANDNNINILSGTFDIKGKINNPKTMIIQTNNLNKYNIDNNISENNIIENNNKTEINSGSDNQKINNQNKINNNINIKPNYKKDLNPSVKVNQINNTINIKNNNNNLKNVGNTNLIQGQNNNSIKNINNTNIPKNNVKVINNNNQIYNANHSNNIQNIKQTNNVINNQNHPNVKIRQNIPQNNQKIPQNNIQFNKLTEENKKVIANQNTGQKINIPMDSIKNNTQNIGITNSKYSKNNNPNNRYNYNQKIQNENSNQNPLQQNEQKQIGLRTPGNEPLSQKSANNQLNNNIKTVPNTNRNRFFCQKCKNPIYKTDIIYCQKCFKNEIIDEAYTSYLEYFSKFHKDKPEQVIKANIAIINFKNEKKIYNLDGALSIYNSLFQNEKIGRKEILLELKKRICIVCNQDIQNKNYIELPCKCRICCKNDLNVYFAYYQNFSKSFICTCKEIYDVHMMMKLVLIKELNNDIITRIQYFFQNKLNICCCMCAKTDGLRSYSNKLISLEKPEYNPFLRCLYHYFCQNCSTKLKNSEFDCAICHFKHFLN